MAKGLAILTLLILLALLLQVAHVLGAHQTENGLFGQLILYSDGSFKLKLSGECTLNKSLTRLRVNSIAYTPKEYHLDVQMDADESYLDGLIVHEFSLSISRRILERVEVEGDVHVNVTSDRGNLAMSFSIEGRAVGDEVNLSFTGMVNTTGEYTESFLYNLIDLIANKQYILFQHHIISAISFYSRDNGYHFNGLLTINSTTRPIHVLPPELDKYVPEETILKLLTGYEVSSFDLSIIDWKNGTVTVILAIDAVTDTGKVALPLTELSRILPLPSELRDKNIEIYFTNATTMITGDNVTLETPRIRFEGVTSLAEVLQILSSINTPCNVTLDVLPGDENVEVHARNVPLQELSKVKVTQNYTLTETPKNTEHPGKLTTTKTQQPTQPGSNKPAITQIELALTIVAIIMVVILLALRK